MNNKQQMIMQSSTNNEPQTNNDEPRTITQPSSNNELRTIIRPSPVELIVEFDPRGGRDIHDHQVALKPSEV